MDATLLPLLLLACSSTTPAERYGFVAVLGNDTVALERIERSPTRLVTDGVDRWPFVRRRHTTLDLAPDGRIRRMVMDVRTPNGGSPSERGRRVTAAFAKDRVSISVSDSGGVRDTAFATGGAITVPHVSMMYSVIELEIATALRSAAAAGLAAGDSVLFRQFYPDRDVGPSFTLHRGWVHLGNVIGFDRVWRTGANAATQFTTSVPITLAGLPVPAGTYTLWTVPRRGRADLIVNKQTGQWGTEYGRAHDLGTAPMKSDSVATPVEQFTIAVEPKDDRRGTLSLAWGTFRWTAPIVVR